VFENGTVALAMKNGDAKKSETLEVRVSYDTKRELSERAKLDGR